MVAADLRQTSKLLLAPEGATDAARNLESQQFRAPLVLEKLWTNRDLVGISGGGEIPDRAAITSWQFGLMKTDEQIEP